MGPFSVNTQLRGGGRGGEKLQLYWEPWEFPARLDCRTGRARGEPSTPSKPQQERAGILPSTGCSASPKARQPGASAPALLRVTATPAQGRD